MVDTTSKWEDELGRWLEPFLDRLGHKARRRMCPLYVAGLIGPGDRKSIQPMAERLAPGDYDRLHHFVAAGVWDAAPLATELLIAANRLVGGSDAGLVRAGVPVDCRTALTKPEIALAEIDRVLAAGVEFGCVLADAGYGRSAPFRHGLTARQLTWAVGIPHHLKVYPIDVELIWPVAG